ECGWVSFGSCGFSPTLGQRGWSRCGWAWAATWRPRSPRAPRSCASAPRCSDPALPRRERQSFRRRGSRLSPAYLPSSMGWPGESALESHLFAGESHAFRRRVCRHRWVGPAKAPQALSPNPTSTMHTAMTNRRIAVLGAGNMGRALITGLLRSGTRPEHLSVGEPSAASRERLARELAITAAADNAAAVAGASVVVLAVKPEEARAVLGALAGHWGARPPLLVSVAAGLRVAALEAWCGPGVAVVRAMPNRPALVGAAATGLFAPRAVAAAQRAVAEQLL